MSDITRQKTIDYLYYLKTHYPKNLIIPEYIDFAISSLETDEAYQLEYESTTKNDISDKSIIYKAKESKEIQKDLDKLSELNKTTTKNDLGVDWDELKRKILMEVDGGTDDKWLRYADVCDNISNSIDEFKAALPSVTPQEPKTGHWTEEFNDLEGEVRFTCSSCGKYQLFGTDFCYHCGSDNREVVEE